MDTDDLVEVPAAGAFDPDAHTRELCSEYERVLSIAIALAGDSDPCLDGACVLEVAPHPDARSVLVVVVVPAELLLEASAALESATERLRRELQRARADSEAPHLTFRVMPAPAISS